MSKKKEKLTAGYIADALYDIWGETEIFELSVDDNSSLSKTKLSIKLFPEDYDAKSESDDAYGIYEYFGNAFADSIEKYKGKDSYDEETKEYKYQLVDYKEIAIFIYYFLKYLDDNKDHAYIRQIDDIDKFIKQVYRHLVMLVIKPRVIG